MERNRIRGLVTELQGLLNLTMNGAGRKAGFFSNLPYGLVLGMKVDELLEVLGFGEDVLLAKVISLTDSVFIDKLGVALFLLQFEEKHLLAVVLIQSGVDFNLLDIAKFRTLGASAATLSRMASERISALRRVSGKRWMMGDIFP